MIFSILSSFKNWFNPKDPTWEELQKKYPYMDINPDYTLPCSGTYPIKKSIEEVKP